MEIILLKDVENARSSRRGRERGPRVCPQLPASPQARRGRDARPCGRGAADRGGPRPARGAQRRAGGDIADTLGKTVLRFDVKAGPTGSLFGSVTTTDIADEIWRTRKIRVDRRKIGVDSIKRIGRYAVPINVFEGVVAELKLMVVPEGGELPPEEELAAMEAAEAAAAAEAACRRAGRRRGRRVRQRGRAEEPPRPPVDDRRQAPTATARRPPRAEESRRGLSAVSAQSVWRRAAEPPSSFARVCPQTHAPVESRDAVAARSARFVPTFGPARWGRAGEGRPVAVEYCANACSSDPPFCPRSGHGRLPA